MTYVGDSDRTIAATSLLAPALRISFWNGRTDKADTLIYLASEKAGLDFVDADVAFIDLTIFHDEVRHKARMRRRWSEPYR
jgi:hypothetical protein